MFWNFFYLSFVKDIINDVELSILINTGSVVTIMYEEVWKIVKTLYTKVIDSKIVIVVNYSTYLGSSSG